MPSQANLDLEVTLDSAVPIPDGISEAVIASLASHVLATEGMAGWWQLGIQFMDDTAMQAAHAEFMGIDSPTDIMTFPYDDGGLHMPLGDAILHARGGDLMISVDRAADHAADAGWSTPDEVLFLVVHGLLHILGWDDGSDQDRARMLDRQSELIESWQRGEGLRERQAL